MTWLGRGAGAGNQPLIGRSAAHALVSAYRVVTLTEPGGIGKTALALEVARSVVGEFADGGWLVELASLSDPDLVPSAVAGALGLSLRSNIISPDGIIAAATDREPLSCLLFSLRFRFQTIVAAVPCSRRRRG